MKSFEKQSTQKNSDSSFFKKQKFLQIFSVRFVNFGFLELVFSSKQNILSKKEKRRVQSVEQKKEFPSFQQSKIQTNILKKKLLNGYSKIHELKLVTIELASPEKIQSWAEKELPNGKIFGEVTNANTFHYRTFKPSKGGLFCERIFGPIKDFECACGKRQRPTAIESKKILEHEQTSRYFCPICDVEYTWSILRRYQLGYIKFNAPVAHLWYFKTNPSYLSILFDIQRKHLESIIYCNETITIENIWKYSEQNSVFNRSPKDLYLTWQKFFNLEKKLQKYQLFHENKLEFKKQKRKVFRNLSFTQKKILPQVNWQRFDRKTYKNQNNFSPSFPFEKTVEIPDDFCKNVAKYQNLSDFSKQKQKQIFFLFFEDMWKKFLQKNVNKAFFFFYSQESFSNQFFEKMSFIFNVFLFSSKKNKKFPSFSEISLFLNFEVLKKELVLSNIYFNEKTKKFFLKDFEISEKKKYWKSFMFFFEFATFFIDQKKRKIKTFDSISKKNFLFLINLLPFLKKILLLKHCNFLKTKTSNKSPFFDNKAVSIFQREGFFHWKEGMIFQSFTNQKSGSILFSEFLNFSRDFKKVLVFLKSLYEVDFCSFIQKEYLDSRKNKEKDENTLNLDKIRKNTNFHIYSNQKVEVFFKESQIFFRIEKVFMDFFCLFLYLFQKNQNQKSLKNFSEFFRKIESSESFSKKFKIQKFLFFGLKYIPSFLLFFSKSEKEKKKTENKKKDFEIEKNEKKEFSLSPFFLTFQKERKEENQKRFVSKKKTIFPVRVSNKPLFLQMKINERKKEIQKNRIQKFLELNSVSDDFELYFSSQKKSDLLSKKISKIEFDIDSEKKNKSFFSNRINTFKKKRTSPKSILKIQIRQNQEFNQTSHFLKNRISTISYNFAWKNDADWKYFIYSNSLFFYEFEDSPICIYDSLFPLNSKKKNQSFLISGSNSPTPLKNRKGKTDESFSSFFSWSIDSFSKNFFVGAGILEKLFTEYTSFELRKMTKQHQILLPKMNQVLRLFKQNSKTKKDSLKIQKFFQKREHIIRRLKYLRKFSRRNSNPTFLILRNLPVLPPDLRPILKFQNQIAASDLNRFYQRIIYRNDRLKKFSKDSATNQSFEMKYAQRLLQEAVDNLIQNGKGKVKAETNSRGQPLKSLSEILKGKQGRFRQYLLGKRVDYSGRSVIVVGPELKLYECGLPKEMAFELFLPFLIQYILQNKLSKTVIGAKTLLKSDSILTLHLLNKVMKNIPVLLNRAPTLHRLGFQAFLPKLIEGRAILLHPMVCPAFNADFDGDQMAIHIPLTVEARTEAWKFLLSTNNLMNSATGEAILLPSQDMVLGCYFLTIDFHSKFAGVQISNSFKKQKFQKFLVENKSFLFFQNLSSVITAYQHQDISLHTPVWVRWNAAIDFGNEVSKPVEIRLQTNGCWEEIHSKYRTLVNQQNKKMSKFIRTTPGRILMNSMIQESSFR